LSDDEFKDKLKASGVEARSLERVFRQGIEKREQEEKS